MQRTSTYTVAALAFVASLGFLTLGTERVTSGTAADTSPQSGPRTAWGDPDLQGIWTVEYDTPLQRPARFADKELFSDEERGRLDEERGALQNRDKRVERGTELDVAGAYNSVFLSFKRTGRRTSLITDPPSGRLPALTPDAQQIVNEDRAFRLALLRSTDTCKSKSVACAGGAYDPTPSPRFAEQPSRYNTGRMNRHDGPEDNSLADRCLGGGLPDFGTAYGGSFRRIVQSKGAISIYYDTGQGQGFQRTILMDGRPHLPPHIRQWWGDSRGRWEGDTLVVDVTNFSPKSEFNGARGSRHMVERWRRKDDKTLEYTVTVEDPTWWTAPWTATEDFTKQSDRENRIYYEPRCHEGNHSFPAWLRGSRVSEAAHAQGRGSHPATKDTATDFVGVEDNPLQ